MPASLEERRRAIVEALRALSRENPKPRRRPAAAATTDIVTQHASASADLHAVEARLDALSRQVAEVISRLSSVETAVLESVWERPDPSPEPDAADAPVVVVVVDDARVDEAYADDERVSVPAVPLGEVRMSSEASRALFGG